MLLSSIIFLNMCFNNGKIYVTNTPYTTRATKCCSAHMAYFYPTDLKSWEIEFTLLTTEIETKSWFSCTWGAAGTVQTDSSANKNHKRKAGLTLGVSIKVVSVHSQTTRIGVKVRYSVFYNQRRQWDPRRRKPK